VEGDCVRVAVRDNGQGIDPPILPYIFDLFIQAERTPDRSQGGLGLGLALVKQLTALHGGTVAVHSDGPGKGSCFVVRVPAMA
ncbi:MAG: ATP-binding protein, partial [Massilia sp.]